MTRNLILFALVVLAVGSMFAFWDCDEEESEPYDDSYLCDPSVPVVLNGVTIPEGRI